MLNPPLKNSSILFLFIFFLTCCNSVFYQPNDKKYGDPSMVNLDYEEIELTTKSGEHIQGWYIPAEGKKLGLVVQFHGNAQNMTAHLGFSYWLPQQGYDLITFDYRGYGNSEGKPTPANTTEDGIIILQEALKRNKGEPIFVLGQSLGGAIATSSIAKFGSEHIAGLVLESTFSSYRHVARTKLADSWFTYLFSYPLSFLIFDDASPIYVLDKIKCPVLFFHGSADIVVPFSEGLAFAEELNKHTKVNFVTILGGKHIPAFVFNGDSYKKIMLEFMQQNKQNAVQK